MKEKKKHVLETNTLESLHCKSYAFPPRAGSMAALPPSHLASVPTLQRLGNLFRGWFRGSLLPLAAGSLA